MDDKNFNDPSVASDWIQSIESDRAKVRENDLYPLLREWLKQTSAQEILDIGAGQGICSENIDLGDRKYTGLEASPLLVDRAKTQYPQRNRQFILGNIYEMPLPAEAFDAAFSVAVWHLLSDIQKASAELSRVLKRGGHFLIVTANPGAYGLWTALYTETSQSGIRLDGKVTREGKIISSDTLYLHTLESIQNSLSEAGLRVDSVEPFRLQATGKHQYVCIRGQKAQ